MTNKQVLNKETLLQYGSKSVTEVLEDGESTKTTEEVYYEGLLQLRKVHYKVPHRTNKTDIAALEKLCVNLFTDPKKLDPSLTLEHTRNGDKNGYYNIIECYTLLER